MHNWRDKKTEKSHRIKCDGTDIVHTHTHKWQNLIICLWPRKLNLAGEGTRLLFSFLSTSHLSTITSTNTILLSPRTHLCQGSVNDTHTYPLPMESTTASHYLLWTELPSSGHGQWARTEIKSGSGCTEMGAHPSPTLLMSGDRLGPDTPDGWRKVKYAGDRQKPD